VRTSDWVKRLAGDPELEFLTSPHLGDRQLWRSVAPEARAVLFAARYLERPQKTLIITASYERALHWQAKLQLSGVSPAFIHQLPSGTGSLFEDAAPEHISLSDRLGSLRALVEDQPNIILASPSSALERTLPRDVLISSFLELKVGDEIDLEAFTGRLAGAATSEASQYESRANSVCAAASLTSFRPEKISPSASNYSATPSKAFASLTPTPRGPLVKSPSSPSLPLVRRSTLAMTVQLLNT